MTPQDEHKYLEMQIYEKILLKVLKKVGSGKALEYAPDEEYLSALETIGFVHVNGTMILTRLGKHVMDSLKEKEMVKEKV